MLFNSIEFAFFLPIVFGLYWFVFNKNLRNQNMLIVVASYIFYGWWDWRYLLLIAFSSFVDFFIGVGIANTTSKTKSQILFYTSLGLNLGILCFFKYFNFFITSFVDAFTYFGYRPDYHTLKIILPVGISFYTFQTLSYTIDVYKKKISATKDLISFLAFVSFFPQLVAGPIERASHLLPQFYVKRVFIYSKAVDGLRQILWGLFKKVVIADTCSPYVNDIFTNVETYNGSTLLLGAIFFSFQIYCDFSGYSDIARGTAKLFGFSLMTNFALPYFSRDIAEFWRRWHISLSTWFKDYIYIPLGGNRGNTWIKIRNTFIVFLLSGLWHGANWTFIVWGAFHAFCFLPLLLLGKNRTHIDMIAAGKKFPTLTEFTQVGITFLLVSFGWIFFRSPTIHASFYYIQRMFSASMFKPADVVPYHLLVLLTILIGAEWMTRTRQHPLAFEKTMLNKTQRWLVYNSILLTIILFWGSQTEFIYFQF